MYADRLAQDMPALVAPKVEIILAALKCARDEILWHLRHSQPVLPAHKDWPPKGTTATERLEWEREHISDLVHLHDAVSQILKDNMQRIADYYSARLREEDYVEIAQLLEAADAQVIRDDPRVWKVCSANLQYVQNAVSGARATRAQPQPLDFM